MSAAECSFAIEQAVEQCSESTQRCVFLAAALWPRLHVMATAKKWNSWFMLVHVICYRSFPVWYYCIPFLWQWMNFYALKWCTVKKILTWNVWKWFVVITLYSKILTKSQCNINLSQHADMASQTSRWQTNSLTVNSLTRQLADKPTRWH